MKIEMNRESGIVWTGNRCRLKNIIERAKSGETLTIGFIGGSITQGAKATTPENCYAYHVYDWWKKTFPKADFVYQNAGIGATTSQFAVARAKEDLLNMHPDFVIIEFSVNDESNGHFQETYEGLVRKILFSETKPAVLLLYNVFYDTGASAQLQHSKIGRYYDLPAISMQNSVYQELLAGRLENRLLTEDDLHPNDLGHELVASVITCLLEKTVRESDTITDQEACMPVPMTRNSYEKSVRYDNRNCQPVCEGFQKDASVQNGITDCFKNGWTAVRPGSRILFQLSGTGVAIQYRKSVKKPSPMAMVVIDGNQEEARKLNSNFQETWGDKPELETVAEGLEPGMHQIELILTEEVENPVVPFYLTSVIMADRQPEKVKHGTQVRGEPRR